MSDDAEFIKLFLIGEIECRDCHSKATIKIPAAIDHRDFLSADIRWPELPEGWRQCSPSPLNDWDYSEKGFRCAACWKVWNEKHAAKLKVIADKKAKKEAKELEKAAKKEAKRIAKAVEKAAKKLEKQGKIDK